MNRFIILIFLLSTSIIAIAQLPIQKNKPVIRNVQKINLTIEQRQWLNFHYKRLGGLDKNSAITFIRTMPDAANILEGTIEYLISHAAKLADDESSMQTELALLKLEKQALQDKIQSEQNKREKETDIIKKQKLQAGIHQLYAELQLIKDKIKRLEAKLNLILKNAFLL